MRITAALSGFAPALVLFALAGLPSAGLAQPEDAKPAPPAPWEGDVWTRKDLSGGWGGLRSGLADYGIDIDLRLSQYYQGVVSGGVNKKGRYGGTVDYRLQVDFSKLGLWNGFEFIGHARTRFGDDSLSDTGALALPNAGMMMPLPGGYEGTNITGAMLSQTWPLWDGLVGNVVAGKLDAIDLVTGFFPSLDYGQSGFMNVNSLVSAMPWFGAVQGLSLYGGILQAVNTKYSLGQTGFLLTGTANVSNGWDVSDSFDEGVWLAGFQRFFWELDDNMGYFMIFGGYSTKDQASNDPNDFVVIPGQGVESTKSKNPWDIALYIYQDIWQDENNANRKANIFLGGTLGPDDPQIAQWNFFAVAEMYGLIESRPNDRMGVGGWWNQITSGVADLSSLAGQDLHRNMWGLEAYYNVELVPSVHFTADAQLLRNENKDDNLAIVLGGRLVIDF